MNWRWDFCSGRDCSIKYRRRRDRISLRGRESTNCVRIRLRPGLLVDLKRLDRNFYTTSSCGVCGKASLAAVRRMARGPGPAGRACFAIKLRLCTKCPGDFAGSQRDLSSEPEDCMQRPYFDRPGELCLCGKTWEGTTLSTKSWVPVARGPRAVDDRILFVSGRASFELVQKAVRAGIPMLAAVGAPSSLAIELAEASA